jgi:hypothetical protein
MMNDECRTMNGRKRKQTLRRRRIVFLLLCSSFCIHHSSFSAHANPSQEDVFKSIQSNVDDKFDGKKVFAFFVAAAGAVLLIVLLNNRQQRLVVNKKPRKVNHQARLLRELMKTAGLKSAQIKQLKMLSADLRQRGEPVDNLVTLLLCPSLIQKARQQSPPGKPPAPR